MNIMNVSSTSFQAKAPQLKRFCEGGMNRKSSEIAVDVQKSVTPYVKEYFLPKTMPTLEEIAIRYNVPIRLAGVESNSSEWGKTLVNAGAFTKLVDNNQTPGAFDKEVVDFVHESLKKTGL